MTTTAETIPFQAETKELLQLVIHSLYTHREIFLRELISNASDALDKLRVEALKRGAPLADDETLAIDLAIDTRARTLSVTDNGIGMSRDEVVQNIGTIARSGTRRFVEALRRERDEHAPELIGQFGVGFYASFMVADEVVLETRGAGEPRGVRWSSRGTGEYTIEELDREARGTTVSLRLKPAEDAEDDFADRARVRALVRRYSDFIGYPIRLSVDGAEAETVNSKKPLWTRPKSEITDEEYAEFYRNVSHDWHDPLETIHFKAEGATEYAALLFLPRERPFDLFDPQSARARVSLYVKRVFIMADCEELMPVWLRFVRGVVDCADLPLNVSRETLQRNRQIAQIEKRLTKKVLESLEGLLANRREEYEAFWTAFGSVLKEGIYYDDARRDEVARIALFASSAGDAPCTLREYVERSPVKQKEIWVLLAPDLERAARSPHLEAFTRRGLEVLFLTDPVDEFVLQRLTEFEGRPFRQIDKGEVDLGDEEAAPEREAKEKELAPLLEAMRKELSERVVDVRFSNRLTESPAVLVAGEHDLSPQLERLLREQGRPLPPRRRVLELNAAHPLIERLRALADDDATFARFSDYCELVWEQALVAEGSPPSDPARFTRLLTELMLRG